MTSLLLAIALCAGRSPFGGGGAAEAFVTPPVVGNHNRDTAAPMTPLRRQSYGQAETSIKATVVSRGRSNRSGEQQQLTMSRLNGADVSEDLSQLNGAAAAAVPSQNTVRVSFSQTSLVFCSTHRRLSAAVVRHEVGTATCMSVRGRWSATTCAWMALLPEPWWCAVLVCEVFKGTCLAWLVLSRSWCSTCTNKPVSCQHG